MANSGRDRQYEEDIVITSRVRMARNLEEYPFPAKIDAKQSERLINTIKDTVFDKKGDMADRFLYFNIPNLSPIDKMILVEKHLISKELVESRRLSGAMISKDEKISIMVNEEDHLRIQSLMHGMMLDEALDVCNDMDDFLDKKIDFAFNDRLGYLTSCPTNIGTGIRASVMMHLPAIVMTGYVRGILEACSKVGITIRGLYGENTEATGNLFQVSNQVTLGMSEEEIISNLKNIVRQIIEQELVLRDDLYKQNTYMFEDKLFRSLGILRSARIISSEESLKLLSDVRLGIDMGIIKDVKIDTINVLSTIIQPGSLQSILGSNLGNMERDVGRAEILRTKLRND